MYCRGQSLLVLYLLVFLSSFSYSATPEEEEYKKIQAEMAEQKKKLSEVQKKEYSVLSDFEETNKKLGKIEDELRGLRKNLKKTEHEISTVNSELEKNRASLKKQNDW